MEIPKLSKMDLNPGPQSPQVDEIAKRESVWSRLYNGHTAIKFVGNRRHWYAISAVVIAIGGLALGIRGLNFGIDFIGGTSWDVSSTSMTVTQARNVMSGLGIKQPTIIALGSGNSTTIEVQADLSGLNSLSKELLVTKVTNALASAAHTQASKVSINDVGPTWGGEVTTKALEALLGFFIAITLYITVRFEFKMALAALVAVSHDLAVTVGIYALVGFEVTPATVIAVLTILGYSLYDTIVVFDRVNENVKALVNPGRLSYADAVDLSMNQVLMRSLNTSIVAIIPILSVLIIGAELLGATTLQQFGLALFIGLTTGAYSSLFIASPLLATIKSRESRYKSLELRLAAKELTKDQKANKSKPQGTKNQTQQLGATVSDSAIQESKIQESIQEPNLSEVTRVNGQPPMLVDPSFRSNPSRAKRQRRR